MNVITTAQLPWLIATCVLLIVGIIAVSVGAGYITSAYGTGVAGFVVGAVSLLLAAVSAYKSYIHSKRAEHAKAQWLVEKEPGESTQQSTQQSSEES